MSLLPRKFPCPRISNSCYFETLLVIMRHCCWVNSKSHLKNFYGLRLFFTLSHVYHWQLVHDFKRTSKKLIPSLPLFPTLKFQSSCLCGISKEKSMPTRKLLQLQVLKANISYNMNSLVHSHFWVHKENGAIKDTAYAKPSFISNKKPQSHPSFKEKKSSWYRNHDPATSRCPYFRKMGAKKKVKHYGKRLCRPLPTMADFVEFCPTIMSLLFYESLQSE